MVFHNFQYQTNKIQKKKSNKTTKNFRKNKKKTLIEIQNKRERHRERELTKKKRKKTMLLCT